MLTDSNINSEIISITLLSDGFSKKKSFHFDGLSSCTFFSSNDNFPFKSKNNAKPGLKRFILETILEPGEAEWNLIALIISLVSNCKLEDIADISEKLSDEKINSFSVKI